MNPAGASAARDPIGPGWSGETKLAHQPFAPRIEHAFDVLLALVLFVELVLLFGNTATRTTRCRPRW